MKKALALVLSLLVALSMFSLAAFAADIEEIENEANVETGYVKVVFVKDGIVAKTLKVKNGVTITPDFVPDVETEFFTDGEDGARFKYTFKGWKSSVDQKYYYDGTIPAPDGSVALITYTAEFNVEDYSERQTFWSFIESIFARFNILFEYFATIFNF